MEYVMNDPTKESVCGGKYSSVTIITCNKKIKLPPYFIGNVKKGVRLFLDSEINQYSERLDGAILSHDNIVIKSINGEHMIDQPFIYFDASVDLHVFKPVIGDILKGVVNKRSKDHIGCLVHGFFNVSLAKSSISPTCKIQLGNEVLFEVTFIEFRNTVMFLRGKFKGFLNDCSSQVCSTDSLSESDDGYNSASVFHESSLDDRLDTTSSGSTSSLCIDHRLSEACAECTEQNVSAELASNAFCDTHKKKRKKHKHTFSESISINEEINATSSEESTETVTRLSSRKRKHSPENSSEPTIVKTSSHKIRKKSKKSHK